MAHPLPLGAQVVDVLGIRAHRERHPVDDLEPEAFETTVLGGVVRHQPHCAHTEVDEDVRADAVLAAVDGQARARCSRRRCHGPDPGGCRRGACARARCHAPRARGGTRRRPLLRRDHRHRRFELRAAVALERAEHVAGEALAVHADEHVVGALHVAADERQVGLAVEDRLERDAREVTPLASGCGPRRRDAPASRCGAGSG